MLLARIDVITVARIDTQCVLAILFVRDVELDLAAPLANSETTSCLCILLFQITLNIVFIDNPQ